jgi:bifunctional ADP-heptose synthase (sugar kinase/adenylyltransferase)
LHEAAWMANCGAGVVVAKKGTATVSKEELRHFYGRLYEALH